MNSLCHLEDKESIGIWIARVVGKRLSFALTLRASSMARRRGGFGSVWSCLAPCYLEYFHHLSPRCHHWGKHSGSNRMFPCLVGFKTTSSQKSEEQSEWGSCALGSSLPGCWNSALPASRAARAPAVPCRHRHRLCKKCHAWIQKN